VENECSWHKPLCYLWAKNYQSWWTFDKLLTKKFCTVFLEIRCTCSGNIQTHKIRIRYRAELISWPNLWENNTVASSLYHSIWMPLYLTNKKSRTFQNPHEKFVGSFRSLQLFKYKEKTALLRIFRVQSIAENSAWSKMWTLAVQNSDELIYIWSFKPLEKCMTLKDIFPGLSRTFSFNFQDFPGPKWFSRTFQVLEFWRKKFRTFQEPCEQCEEIIPANISEALTSDSDGETRQIITSDAHYSRDITNKHASVVSTVIPLIEMCGCDWFKSRHVV